MSQELIPKTAEVTIVKEENISTIVKAGPENYQLNKQSCDNCLAFGQKLLQEIEAAGGMTDTLDQRVADFLGKASRTRKVMNERRSPVTKLFDQVRSEFTVLENTIDAAKAGTIPNKLQALRDAYAKHKLEIAEAKRREEEAKRAIEQARINYSAEVTDDYKRSFNILLTDTINQLTQLNSSVTLDNYEAAYDTLTGYSIELPAEWCPQCNVRQPYVLTVEECRAIRQSCMTALMNQFEVQYREEIGDYRQELLDALPSKKVELERMAQADAAEAARLKAEVAKREAEEAARREQERRQREEEERKKAELDKANAEMSGLFADARAELQQVGYQPKVKVQQKIVITEPDAILSVISTWWQKEGCALSVDELCKMFKKQITFCEKLANKDNFYITADGLDYIDDVKAK